MQGGWSARLLALRRRRYSHHLTRRGDIAMDLLHQIRDGVETALVPKAGDELDPQIAIVQIDLGIQEMDFDDLGPAIEGWSHADVGHTGHCLSVEEPPHRIHPPSGNDHPLGAGDIRSGNTDLTTTAVPRDDDPFDLVRSSQHRPGAPHVSFADRVADGRRPYRPAVDVPDRDGDHRESEFDPEAAERCRITGGLIPKSKPFPNRHVMGAKAPNQVALDEVSRPHMAELIVELEHRSGIDTHLGENLEATRHRRESERSSGRRQHGRRMDAEGQHDSGCRRRYRIQRLDNGLVPAVDTIEDADGYGRIGTAPSRRVAPKHLHASTTSGLAVRPATR